jgi:hypothetical protein
MLLGQRNPLSVARPCRAVQRKLSIAESHVPGALSLATAPKARWHRRRSGESY